MQLYAGSSTQFIEDTVQNQIAGKLKDSFFHHYCRPASDSEVRSWHNSLSKMKDVLERAELRDHGVVLEYQLPLSSKRLDCMIMGKGSDRHDNAVIVELKQWEHCEPADGENEVVTWTGRGNREVLHPSVQVNRYEMYMKDGHTAFYEGTEPIGLHSCSYLHNYTFEPKDLLLSPKYRQAIELSPLFSADDVDRLCGYLTGYLDKGDGLTVLRRVQESRFRPSKKLLEHVAGMIASRKEYVLLDEQQVIYDSVFAAVKRGFHDKKKSVILVQGGPGTGKSVIALNLMADLSRQEYNAHYATGSKSFTTTLQKVIGARAAPQFKYFNSYAQAASNEIDVLILDESHRIRQTSVDRFTKKENRSGKAQIEELLDAAKVCVFFIDDRQGVRPNEVGSSTLIREAAAARGFFIREYELETQFRCAGSDTFVNWVDNTLEVHRTPTSIWEPDGRFDFKVFDSPEALDQAIRMKAVEGNTARLTAGFCWPWSKPRPDGTLVSDVKVGAWSRPWNAQPEATRLAPGIPKASVWAWDPRGMEQVGCIYTAQGFEFDYVGVIFGSDLAYNPAQREWKANADRSEDKTVRRSKDAFLTLVKNTYRVLMSRGMKGCYVYFVDKDTRNFFLSRTTGSVLADQPSSIQQPQLVTKAPTLKILDDVPETDRFVKYLPVYSLAAAAGGFSEDQTVRPAGWVDASGHRLAKDMFIARVVGKSMEPLIPDGSWCIFKADRGGTREGKVILAQSSAIQDPESSGRFTVKRYHSEKEFLDDGTWRHKTITLSPVNKSFQPIILENVEADAFRVAAEWMATL